MLIRRNQRILNDLNRKVDHLNRCVMNQGRSIREDISTQSKLFHRSLDGIESRLRAVELHLEYGHQTRGTCSNGYTDIASNDVVDS